MTKIKICGIKREEDISIVNKYKPDYIGFVFADSPRQIDFNTSKNLKEKLDNTIKSVGVFVDENIDTIINYFKSNIIDIAQLHGIEDEDFIKELKLKALNETNKNIEIINVIDVNKQTINSDKINQSKADYLLFDSGKGSGKTFNWNKINKDINKPIFLAGGLNQENIAQAIDEINPYCVDLSSGTETNGIKDQNKIKKIIEIVKGD